MASSGGEKVGIQPGMAMPPTLDAGGENAIQMKQKSTVVLDPPRRQAASNMMTRRGACSAPRFL